jgi:hypothetical protein
MDALVNVALQKQLFQDLLEINEAMNLAQRRSAHWG